MIHWRSVAPAGKKSMFPSGFQEPFCSFNVSIDVSDSVLSFTEEGFCWSLKPSTMQAEQSIIQEIDVCLSVYSCGETVMIPLTELSDQSPSNPLVCCTVLHVHSNLQLEGGGALCRVTSQKEPLLLGNLQPQSPLPGPPAF